MHPNMSPVALAITGAMLSACVEVSSPPAGSGPSAPPQLALFGTGYPNTGDPCRRAGESAFTANYLDDAADLVACPPSTDAGLFAFTYGAQQVATLDGWYLFSIPRR
jgi:hypothetical protein